MIGATMETIKPLGRFSLRAAAAFGFGPTEGRPPTFDGVMRMAFCVDGGQGYAGAVLRQRADDGPVGVELTLRDEAAPEAALAQVARTVSLDHDGAAFADVGVHDPVIGALQSAHPGERPVLFHSPYEAAAWSVISARRPAAQGAKVRAALSQRLGRTFELVGRTLHAFPQPSALAQIPDTFPGLNDTKIARLRELAAAATAGELDVARIQELGPEAALDQLQQLPGIGPFYASLIVLRASGFADAYLGAPERRGADHAVRYYGISDPDRDRRLAEIADGWRPFRTWCMVLVRLAGERGTRLTSSAPRPADPDQPRAATALGSPSSDSSGGDSSPRRSSSTRR
jgi:DNA-3-methyladenine glycosylase II